MFNNHDITHTGLVQQIRVENDGDLQNVAFVLETEASVSEPEITFSLASTPAVSLLVANALREAMEQRWLVDVSLIDPDDQTSEMAGIGIRTDQIEQ